MIAVAGYLNFVDNKVNTDSGLALNEQGELDALAPSSLNGFEIGQALTLPEEEDDNPAISTSTLETNDSATANAATVSANSETAAQSPGTSEQEPGSAVFVNTQQESSYFVQMKLKREQARGREKDTYMELFNSEGATQTVKEEAKTSMDEIAKRIEKETSAETMLESKGFSEVYVRIDDNGVDVIVNKEKLTEAEIAQIEDVIKRKTGMSVEQIHISTMKK
jgi:stage III sporulation protein AH